MGRFPRPAGGLPCLSPACPAFSLLFCPPSPKGKDIPPTPFPNGEGGDSRLFHARGSAPCIPGAEPARHLHDQRFLFVYGGAVPAAKERGDRGRGTSAFEMVLSPGAGIANAAGGLPFLSPACPAFSFASAHPPTPLPRRGRGRTKVISCKGLRPLHPRGLNPRGTCTTKGFCLFTGGQCRQPRRGGTGGEELRRLRWSSPPGQG